MESEVRAVRTGRERPEGVSLIAIWLVFSGIVTLLASGIPLITHFSKGGSFSPGAGIDIIAAQIAVIALVQARGLWALKSWAVPWTIGLLIITVLSKVAGIILVPTPSSIVVQALAMALNLWIIYYLATSKKVREIFRRS